MEKKQQNKHNKGEKEEEKLSKLSSALKKNLLRRKTATKTKKEKGDE